MQHWQVERAIWELLVNLDSVKQCYKKKPPLIAKQCQASLTSAAHVRSPIREWRSKMSPGTVITVPVTDAPSHPPTTHCVPSTLINNSYAQEHVKGTCSVRALLSLHFTWLMHKGSGYASFFLRMEGSYSNISPQGTNTFHLQWMALLKF